MLYEDYSKLKETAKNISEKINFKPKVALILGSGLGAVADEIETVAVVNYSDIDGFPQSTVQGHKGRFVFGYIEKTPVVIMQGRVHFYEGYSMQEVVLPTRLMRLLGAEILFLTNASGGINFDYNAGDLMLIKDHISTFVPSPLVGKNVDELGTRFPDMSEVYDKKLREIIKKTARKSDIELHEGVYLQTSGPNYETPAEIRMFRTLGADAVGMSTACEAMAGVHCGFKVCGISLVTNKAAGVGNTPLSHKEVQEAADKAAPLFKKLVKDSVAEMGGYNG
jgi:purine-nucleoside phosphorylase